MANVFDLVKGVEHAVCESSRLKATTAGHIYDLKCHEALDNGSIVAIGAHIEGQLFNSKVYAEGETPYLVLTPPIAYNGNQYKSAEKFFYNEAGEVARAYELHKDDIFTISAIAFTGTPAVGKYVDATYTVADAAGEAGFVGEIIEEVVYTDGMAYRILVREINK